MFLTYIFKINYLDQYLLRIFLFVSVDNDEFIIKVQKKSFYLSEEER